MQKHAMQRKHAKVSGNRKVWAILLAVVLVLTNMPMRAEAASTTAKVTTQAGLEKALQDDSITIIRISGKSKTTLTIPAGDYTGKSITVNASGVMLVNSGAFKKITVTDAKTFTECASGNAITVKDDALDFTAKEGAEVKKLTLASAEGSINIVNEGSIKATAVTGAAEINLEQNGKMGRITMSAPADVNVAGVAASKLAFTVKAAAEGASVKSSVPVSLNAYANVELTLEKGAGRSTVTLKNENAGVDLENNTKKAVTVTDSKGNKETVGKGSTLVTEKFEEYLEEKTAADNVGENQLAESVTEEKTPLGDASASDPEVPDGDISGSTGSLAGGSTGGPMGSSTGTGSGTTPTPEATPEVTPEETPEPTPEATPEVTPEVIPEVTPEDEQTVDAASFHDLASALTEAKESTGGTIEITADIVAADHIIVPENVCLKIADGCELDMNDFTIVLTDGASLVGGEGSFIGTQIALCNSEIRIGSEIYTNTLKEGVHLTYEEFEKILFMSNPGIAFFAQITAPVIRYVTAFYYGSIMLIGEGAELDITAEGGTPAVIGVADCIMNTTLQADTAQRTRGKLFVNGERKYVSAFRYGLVGTLEEALTLNTDEIPASLSEQGYGSADFLKEMLYNTNLIALSESMYRHACEEDDTSSLIRMTVNINNDIDFGYSDDVIFLFAVNTDITLKSGVELDLRENWLRLYNSVLDSSAGDVTFTGKGGVKLINGEWQTADGSISADFDIGNIIHWLLYFTIEDCYESGASLFAAVVNTGDGTTIVDGIANMLNSGYTGSATHKAIDIDTQVYEEPVVVSSEEELYALLGRKSANPRVIIVSGASIECAFNKSLYIDANTTLEIAEGASLYTDMAFIEGTVTGSGDFEACRALVTGTCTIDGVTYAVTGGDFTASRVAMIGNDPIVLGCALDITGLGDTKISMIAYNGGSISLNGDAYIGYGVAIISYVNTYENLNDALNVMCYAPYYSGRVVVYVDADITCHGNVYIPAECDLIIVDGAHLDLNGYRVICDGSFVE